MKSVAVVSTMKRAQREKIVNKRVLRYWLQNVHFLLLPCSALLEGTLLSALSRRVSREAGARALHRSGFWITGSIDALMLFQHSKKLGLAVEKILLSGMADNVILIKTIIIHPLSF